MPSWRKTKKAAKKAGSAFQVEQAQYHKRLARSHAKIKKAGRKWQGRDTFADTGSLFNPRRRKKGNPAQESLEAYKEFHGRESGELVTVQEKKHFHHHLASAGRLEFLKIQTLDKRAMVTLAQFKGALLSYNEKKNQLFVKGGDQHVQLSKFGVKEHEVVTLGHAREVGYFTRKDHLGSEGGTAIFVHKFSRPHPEMIYYTLDEQLVFSGGGYEIRAEGIDK